MKHDASVEPALSARDGWVALLLTALATAVFAATIQDRLWGDGVDLLQLLEWPEREWWRTWAHTLHTPVAEAFGVLHLMGRAHDDFVLASVVPAALGWSAMFLAARLLGAARAPAVLATALVAFSPVVWFFATLLEVHALHFGVVAMAIAAALWLGPRAVGWRFHARHAALFLVVALSHLTALTLVPAWALLGWFARRAPASGRPKLLQDLRAMSIDAALATLGFGAALWLSQLMHYESADEGAVESIADMILGSLEPLHVAYFVDDWIRPMGLVTLVALVLVVVAAARPWRAGLPPAARGFVIVAALGGLPPFLFFTAWAFSNEGGYLVGWLPFVGIGAAAIASHVARRVGPALASLALIALLAVQLFLGHRAAASYEQFLASTRAPERLAAFAAQLHGGELVVGIDTSGQPLRWSIAGVEELDMIRQVRGLPPDEIPAAIGRSLDARVVPFQGPVYVDLSYRAWLVPGSAFTPLIEAFEAEVLARFDYVAVPHSGWPMVRLVHK